MRLYHGRLLNHCFNAVYLDASCSGRLNVVWCIHVALADPEVLTRLSHSTNLAQHSGQPCGSASTTTKPISGRCGFLEVTPTSEAASTISRWRISPWPVSPCTRPGVEILG